MTQYEQMGLQWLQGKVKIKEFNGIKLNQKQIEFIDDKNRFSLVSGGMASGKTTGWIVKFILLTQWFPGTRILIGRKTKSNAQSTFMKDFMDVCPPELYEYKVGEGKLVFTNGTEAVFFGLDALQSGGEDLKKAEQELKSHNFGFVFIDQLEEIEKKVFDALNSRMRKRQCKHSPDEYADTFEDDDGNPLYEVCRECGKVTFSQMCMTTNPANFWGYTHFKSNPQPFTHLVETSMMDNKAFLSRQFLESELNKPEMYVKRYVHGIWDTSIMAEGAVFYEEHLKNQELFLKEPIRTQDGIRIFVEPTNHDYQIGVDPSLGATDPCFISVVDKDTGEQVATYSAYVPTRGITEKAVQLAMMYAKKSNPLIIPEATGVGQALVEDLKKVYDNIYVREVYSNREQKKTQKLGFYTNFQTKTLLIENFKNLLNRNFPKLYDRRVHDEAKMFRYTDEAEKKGAGAPSGFHDDMIMGTMLAYHGLEAKYLQPTTQFEAEEFVLYSNDYE
jgi:hypothetical protein